MKLPRWTPVHVTWIDSMRGQFNWDTFEGASLGRCTSVGMVRANTKKALTLVQSRDKANDNVLSAITIPWCAIVSVKELR